MQIVIVEDDEDYDVLHIFLSLTALNRTMIIIEWRYIKQNYLSGGRSIESPERKGLSFATGGFDLGFLKSSGLGAGLAGCVNPFATWGIDWLSVSWMKSSGSKSIIIDSGTHVLLLFSWAKQLVLMFNKILLLLLHIAVDA